MKILEGTNERQFRFPLIRKNKPETRFWCVTSHLKMFTRHKLQRGKKFTENKVKNHDVG